MKLIVLSQGKVAIVDEQDFTRVSSYKWYAANVKKRNWYAQAMIDGKIVLMHRFILGISSGQCIDHINGDGLDNTRSNLRVATNAQNQHNTVKVRGASKYKGVSFHSPSGKWRSAIRVNGIRHWLGVFHTESEAAEAYAAAAKMMHKEYAPLGRQ